MGSPNSLEPNRSVWPAMLCCLTSTFLFGISNIAIRYLTDHTDARTIIFTRELWAFSVLFPWVIVRIAQGRYRFISKRCILFLFLSSLVSQTLGSPFQLWAFTLIGLIGATPLAQSGQLLASAFLGKIFLKEQITLWKWAAIAVLILSVICVAGNNEISELFGGAAAYTQAVMNSSKADMESPQRRAHTEQAEQPSMPTSAYPQNVSTLHLIAGIAALFGGATFAVNLIIMRYASLSHLERAFRFSDAFRFSNWLGHEKTERFAPFPLTLLMATVNGTGVLAIGTLIFMDKGIAGFTGIPRELWLTLFICGLTNFVGFFFQVLSLRLTTAMSVSLINATQIVFITIIGAAFFNEPVNAVIWIGISLAILGVILSAKPD